VAKSKFPKALIRKPGAKDTHRGVNGRPHRGDHENCEACNYVGAISVCTCGHQGDRIPGDHAGGIGHGSCTVSGCICQQFTWAGFTPAYEAALAKCLTRAVRAVRS
jgi:hypothetical protein